MQTQKTAPVCWLFCTVIDNFGDVGIAWRLAQILSKEGGMNIHLWLDKDTALRTIVPDTPPLPCRHQEINLHHWQATAKPFAADLDTTPQPDIVIETFGCNIPQDVIDIIKKNHAIWLNWEYLSAENWAEAMHAKPSPQIGGIEKFFWLMGFTEHSGGLLREQNYPYLSNHNENLRKTLKLPTKIAPEWLLFGYQSTAWADWLQMWRQHGRPITLLLAGRQIIQSLKAAHAVPENILNRDGSVFQTGPVTLIRLPFIPQNNFDSLLNMCDGLIVRGEDSFVRAQYAAKPFFWHIYPQAENAHIDKLHAFWQKAAANWPPHCQSAHQALSDDLNGHITLSPGTRLRHWQTLSRAESSWQKQAAVWRDFLFAQKSATDRLADFIAKLPNR